jgi:hypothetical protein
VKPLSNDGITTEDPHSLATATEVEANMLVAEDEALDLDDEVRTEAGRTDDDPVGDAFRQVLDGSDDGTEEDEIVWDPRYEVPLTDSAT